MSYNTDLQTNNANLQSILATAQALPDKDNTGTTIQKWVCTLEDGSTVDKYVEVPKEYLVTVEYDDNGYIMDYYYTATHGQQFILNIYTDVPIDYNITWSTLEVLMNKENITDTVLWDSSADTITIPNVTGNIYISVEVEDEDII